MTGLVGMNGACGHRTWLLLPHAGRAAYSYMLLLAMRHERASPFFTFFAGLLLGPHWPSPHAPTAYPTRRAPARRSFPMGQGLGNRTAGTSLLTSTLPTIPLTPSCREHCLRLSCWLHAHLPLLACGSRPPRPSGSRHFNLRRHHGQRRAVELGAPSDYYHAFAFSLGCAALAPPPLGQTHAMPGQQT